jgi:hypothetical protein
MKLRRRGKLPLKLDLSNKQPFLWMCEGQKVLRKNGRKHKSEEFIIETLSRRDTEEVLKVLQKYFMLEDISKKE